MRIYIYIYPLITLWGIAVKGTEAEEVHSELDSEPVWHQHHFTTAFVYFVLTPSDQAHYNYHVVINHMGFYKDINTGNKLHVLYR